MTPQPDEISFLKLFYEYSEQNSVKQISFLELGERFHMDQKRCGRTFALLRNAGLMDRMGRDVIITPKGYDYLLKSFDIGRASNNHSNHTLNVYSPQLSNIAWENSGSQNITASIDYGALRNELDSIREKLSTLELKAEKMGELQKEIDSLIEEIDNGKPDEITTKKRVWNIGNLLGLASNVATVGQFLIQLWPYLRYG